MLPVNNVEIRTAEKKILDKIYDFERSYILEHEPENLKKWDSVKESFFEFLGENLERMFVAFHEKRPVGYGYWSLYEGDPYIYSIYVDVGSRGLGVATLLMKAMEKQIVDEGHIMVALSTLVTNPARFLFSKLEYEEIKREDGWIHYKKRFKVY